MQYSLILTLLSISAVTAKAIEARNANHVSMYTTNACNDHDKYYKWKGTDTCNCIPVDQDAQSIFTDHEPLQDVIAFSDGNCQDTLGPIIKHKCDETAQNTTFAEGRIRSVMFWLGGACELKQALSSIIPDIETALRNAAEFA
ncbi:hypothetical protein GLAREA_04853 [Glarea lozoyensis ATCC 20868]|uniref:Uncharacterized protein n=1 Tax=Glarea lozoyensis (strain ATCC 20868 / MF5171) TaxID=1116229 RepID=S3CNI4_GLAL2|nr:uncharacterized protein GLAREA_04853 [Glarea lozoyensis ATCC 20868]EPE28062.1 hypothetical protein GLAREA_04853 [Glarea lozoyensis ATCC 20868]